MPVNARAGNLLLPMGLVNEMHEPPFYRGNFRPEVERMILPSTWRELGVGLHGAIAERVSYKAYLVNGLDAKDNEFLIGLIGKELHPLSHIVQTMRSTRQTSEFISQMGPFFVGRAVFRHAGK